MAMTSETCGASSSAATRGMRSLPKVVDGPNTCVKGLPISATCGASVAASVMFIGGVRHFEHPRHAGDLRCLRGTGECRCVKTATAISAPASAVAAFTHLGRREIELAVRMFGDDQNRTCVIPGPACAARRTVRRRPSP